jgi:hypothetical protein
LRLSHLLLKHSTDIGWFPHIASSLGLIKPLGRETVILSDAITTLVVVSKRKLREDVALLSERPKGTNRLVFSQDVSHRVPKRASKLVGDWADMMTLSVAAMFRLRKRDTPIVLTQDRIVRNAGAL